MAVAIGHASIIGGKNGWKRFRKNYSSCYARNRKQTSAQEIFIDERKKIIRAFEGEIGMTVAGIGISGTLQGVRQFLKEHDPGLKIVTVEPKNSASLLGREPGLPQIQGIGDGFVPDVLDINLVDKVITVWDNETIETTRQLDCEEGLLEGTSSGANVFSALRRDKGQ